MGYRIEIILELSLFFPFDIVSRGRDGRISVGDRNYEYPGERVSCPFPGTLGWKLQVLSIQSFRHYS